jgi:predicted DNA-binding antitoxin AbrB/MazE fold protein
MTTRVDAIYQGGVFRPLEPVAFSENQRVALNVESIDKQDALAWAKRVSQSREEAASRYGILPDSAIDIATDRMR